MKYILIILCCLSSSVFAESLLKDTDLQEFNGLFNSYYSEKEDKIYLEVEHLDSSFLYVSSLSQGLGNNDLFLDRGQIGNTRIVKFIKSGNKLLLIQPNTSYKAITENELEKRSVKEAFAKSVLHGFEIVEETTNGYLIDLTGFLMQDHHGVSNLLNDRKQGNYSLDKSKSSINIERTKSFPKNVEFDVLITLSGRGQGSLIVSVTPDPDNVTVYQHHSFVELPDNNFKPRKAHPSSGAITTSFMNYSAKVGEEMKVEYCLRHRLEKKNPGSAPSEVKEPIVYYLDNGTPEPIRSALMDGALWWNEAFEDIGFKNAFQVKILPDSVDPLDVRYNVIQWVHRSTRGWSYGASVEDPRTGEIIKGHVSLGSLRIRQDYKIAQALLNGSDKDKMLEFALARIRQLGAHEVGHTLGFAHNFAASLNDRASVMDYPHPWVKLKDGQIDISNAYDKGIGEWDKASVAYVYSEFDENEDEQLQRIINSSKEKGLIFVSDGDSRPIGSSNAFGHLWDNGSDPIDELENVMAVRTKAINQFDEAAIEKGESYEDLEDLFVLLYFYHRYQTEAVIKLIAGREYDYHLKGEGEDISIPVKAEEQRRALRKTLQTIEAEFLAIPKNKLELFPDRGPWDGRDRESFKTLTGSTFDPLSAAQSGTEFTLNILLHPERMNRLLSQSAVYENQLSLEETLDALLAASLYQNSSDEYLSNIQIIINQTALKHLMQLAQSEDIFPQVSAIVNAKIRDYQSYLKKQKNLSAVQKEQIRQIEMYFNHPDQKIEIDQIGIPDGSPIGSIYCGN